MRTSKKTLIGGAATLGLTAILGLGWSVGVATANTAKEPAATPSASAGETKQADTAKYGVNASGETYGSAMTASSADEEPDLIAAQAANGEIGYVRKSELDRAAGSDIQTPAEAAAWNRERQANNAKGATLSVPVYAKDGKTVIGRFVLDDGQVK